MRLTYKVSRYCLSPLHSSRHVHVYNHSKKYPVISFYSTSTKSDPDRHGSPLLQCWVNVGDVGSILKLQSQQTQHMDPMLDQCRPTVSDVGLTLVQHWIDVSFLLGWALREQSLKSGVYVCGSHLQTEPFVCQGRPYALKYVTFTKVSLPIDASRHIYLYSIKCLPHMLFTQNAKLYNTT